MKQCLFLLSGWNMKFSNIIGLYQFLLACCNHEYKECDLKKASRIACCFYISVQSSLLPEYTEEETKMSVTMSGRGITESWCVMERIRRRQ